MCCIIWKLYYGYIELLITGLSAEDISLTAQLLAKCRGGFCLLNLQSQRIILHIRRLRQQCALVVNSIVWQAQRELIKTFDQQRSIKGEFVVDVIADNSRPHATRTAVVVPIIKLALCNHYPTQNKLTG